MVKLHCSKGNWKPVGVVHSQCSSYFGYILMSCSSYLNVKKLPTYSPPLEIGDKTAFYLTIIMSHKVNTIRIEISMHEYEELSKALSDVKKYLHPYVFLQCFVKTSLEGGFHPVIQYKKTDTKCTNVRVGVAIGIVFCINLIVPWSETLIYTLKVTSNHVLFQSVLRWIRRIDRKSDIFLFSLYLKCARFPVTSIAYHKKAVYVVNCGKQAIALIVGEKSMQVSNITFSKIKNHAKRKIRTKSKQLLIQH